MISRLSWYNYLFLLQFVLFVMAIMLSQLLRKGRRLTNRVYPTASPRSGRLLVRERAHMTLDNLEEETTSSFFTSTSTTPSAPPLQSTTSSSSSTTPHFNINITPLPSRGITPLSPHYHNSLIYSNKTADGGTITNLWSWTHCAVYITIKKLTPFCYPT